MGVKDLRGIEWALVIVLVIAGVYFVSFHKDLPFNHESVGLGTLHIVHDAIGFVLLGLAVAIWWRSRGSSKPVAAPPIEP